MTKIAPLAEQFRPSTLSAIFGQNHLVGEHGFITSIIASKKPLSIILWGPPGCGKTSIARLYAKAFGIPFHTLSAIFTSVADLKKLIQETERHPLFNRMILLFVDEIHRFNKAQQDAFLPFIEDGSLVLVGATAENPSFYLNNALLSRLRVLKLNTLDEPSLNQILANYEQQKKPLNLSDEARHYLIHLAQGDGRYLLNLLENLETISHTNILEVNDLQHFLQKRAPLFDRGNDHHYQLISALHKSVRGSDPDASLYWLARMLEAGEEPLFIARRLIRMATEDIGLADPQALQLAISAKDAYQMLGSPEGELALAEVVVYLALSPKSNAIYTAFDKAKALASQTSHLDPPQSILNAPTKLMKEFGYGKGYQYDHDLPCAFSGQNYFPYNIPRQKFYEPIERGFERELLKRNSYFERLRNQLHPQTLKNSEFHNEIL